VVICCGVEVDRQEGRADGRARRAHLPSVWPYPSPDSVDPTSFHTDIACATMSHSVLDGPPCVRLLASQIARLVLHELGCADRLASLAWARSSVRLDRPPSHDLMIVADYADTLDALPLELTRGFSDLRELDAVLSCE
jgi:hypothetical protein